MIRLLLILWIALLSFQSGYRGLAYVYYLWNKDFIKKNLCENRIRPKLKCDEKCHLKKVLKPVKITSPEKPESPSIPNMELLKNTFLFVHEIKEISDWFSPDTYLADLCKSRFGYTFNYQYLPFFEVLHPPA